MNAIQKKSFSWIALVVILTLVVPWAVFASFVDVAVVDVTAPTGTVTLAPGGNGSITINMTVTGNQVGTATFEVNRDWTLSGGVFSGSNPQTFTVNPRAAQDPATTFSTSGTVTVAGGQAAGSFTLAVSSFDITNSNTTGAKLTDGADSTYQVTVSAPSDTTPPVVTVPSNMTVEATSSAGAVVTFAASALDAVDGSITPTCVLASGSTFPLGVNTVACTATDAHGNTGSASFTITVQDTTAPDVTVPGDMTVEATGPSGAVVTFSASASDIVDGPLTPTCAPASGSTFVLGTTEVICSATDAAGNTGSASFNVTVEDTTAPVITWVGGPADGSSHYFGSVPAAPTCTAVDLVSGVVTCDVTGYSAAVGPHTMTATATDDAGITATDTRSYTVLAWTFKGFYQPVDNNGVLNTVKGGSTVPLKFEVFAGSTELTNSSVVSAFAKQVTCNSTSEDTVEVLATGSTSLRYDMVAGQFIYNWQTPKLPGKCYTVTMTTQDGSALSALFKLK